MFVTWVTAIAAVIAAGAAVSSAIIYYRTLQSVNEQTRISGGQAQLIARQLAERFRPALNVNLQYMPPINQTEWPSLRLTISNYGGALIRIIGITFFPRGRSHPDFRERKRVADRTGRNCGVL
jgi:hypothetical protein